MDMNDVTYCRISTVWCLRKFGRSEFLSENDNFDVMLMDP
jgi:hypothetical protein